MSRGKVVRGRGNWMGAGLIFQPVIISLGVTFDLLQPSTCFPNQDGSHNTWMKDYSALLPHKYACTAGYLHPFSDQNMQFSLTNLTPKWSKSIPIFSDLRGGSNLHSLYGDYQLNLSVLRVISIKFLLIIPMLYKTEWSQEFRRWSHKMNLTDNLTSSPNYF